MGLDAAVDMDLDAALITQGRKELGVLMMSASLLGNSPDAIHEAIAYAEEVVADVKIRSIVVLAHIEALAAAKENDQERLAKAIHVAKQAGVEEEVVRAAQFKLCVLELKGAI